MGKAKRRRAEQERWAGTEGWPCRARSEAGHPRAKTQDTCPLPGSGSVLDIAPAPPQAEPFRFLSSCSVCVSLQRVRRLCIFFKKLTPLTHTYIPFSGAFKEGEKIKPCEQEKKQKEENKQQRNEKFSLYTFPSLAAAQISKIKKRKLTGFPRGYFTTQGL